MAFQVDFEAMISENYYMLRPKNAPALKIKDWALRLHPEIF